MGTRKLPKGWEKKGLLDLVDLKKRDKTYGSEIKGKDGKVPVINQSEEGFYGYHNNKPSFIGKKGNGFLTFANHTGAIRYIEYEFSTIQNIFIMLGKEGVITKFIYYLLMFYKINENIGDYAGHFPKFRDEIDYFVPTSKEEQQKIVDYLDEKFKYIDEMEASRQRYVEHLEKLEKAVLRDVFENIKGEEKKFKDIVNNHDGKREPLSQLVRADRKGKYDYYGASGIIDRIDDYIYDGEYLLISEDGANLTVRKYPIAFIAKGKFWVNNHAHVVSGKEGIITNNYLKLFFAYKDINEFITGVTQPKLSQTNLNKIKVPVPDIKTQKIIAYELDKKFELIRDSRERLERQEENFKNLRKAFLNDVFGGFEE